MSVMTTPENKLEEFRDVGSALAGIALEVADQANKPVEALANIFSDAHGAESQLEQANLVRQVWAGIVDASQISVRVNGVDAAAYAAQVRASEAKASTENHLFLIALNDLAAAIDEAEKLADEMERSFDEKYGDSWREDLALRILDEDEIPQRLDGESLADYRERVEQALIAEMIDADGEIKEKYKNDPELKDRAEWAKTRYDIRQAEIGAQELENTYSDPNTTDAERRAARESASQASVRLAKHQTDDESIVAEMDAEIDTRQDDVSSTKSAAVENNFLTLSGQS